jgi:hypothetical protein
MADRATLVPESGTILESFDSAGPGAEARRRLVIASETIDFRGDEARSLTAHLRRFIEEFRSSNEMGDLIAVGSAIRKFMATATADEAMDFAVELLEPNSRAPLSLPVELELTKMIVHKLTSNPVGGRPVAPGLASHLADLAGSYLNPRLLPREKYGAIALNAVLGLAMTGDERSDAILEQVRRTDAAWFTQLVSRRATRLQVELARRGDADRLAEPLRALRRLGDLATS